MADSPKEAEAAQAIFCALVDYLGHTIDPIPRSQKGTTLTDYDVFKDTYEKELRIVDRKVKHPGVTMNAIDTLLRKSRNKWYDSSVNIANQLFEDAGKISKKTHRRIRPTGISLFYLRDEGPGSVMGSVQTLWKYTNDIVKIRNRTIEGKKDITFSNLNKWTPADIYLASIKGRNVLSQLASGATLKPGIKIGNSTITSKSSLVSFSVLNAIMKQLIQNGDLLPLSLKKAPNKDSVVIKTINYIDNDVTNALKKNDVKYHGYIFSQSNDIFNSKDCYIKITPSAHKLQFRDKGSTGAGVAPKYSYQMIITGGKAALDGSMGGGAIGDVLDQTNAQLGRHFSLSSQNAIIQAANRISNGMRMEVESDGTLNRSINNEICNKVYTYAKNYTNLQLGSQLEFYTELYNHPDYGLSGTGIDRKEGRATIRIENETLRMRARAQYLFGKYMGGRLIDAFQSASSDLANQMAINLTLYAGSRTISSSPHIKAADISSF
tara:strand:- start:19 stop:1494 length:1476 start_codon:yes stop_codon:yes gene_type:complete